jgi:hypothetical protein
MLAPGTGSLVLASFTSPVILWPIAKLESMQNRAKRKVTLFVFIKFSLQV